MSILLVLVPLGLVLTGIACWAFFWAVGNGQFDDLQTPASSILSAQDCDSNMPRERGRLAHCATHPAGACPTTTPQASTQEWP